MDEQGFKATWKYKKISGRKGLSTIPEDFKMMPE